MCKSAGVIHEFVPATELFRVAKRCCVVFKEHGDYEHKQRNRMKFMIKKLGWDGFVRRVPDGTRLVPRRRRGAAAARSIRRRWSRRRSGTRADAPSPSLIVARVAAVPPNGPGITPTLVPVLHCRATTPTDHWRRPNVARAEAVRLRPWPPPRCRSAISRASRCACVGELAQRRTATAPCASPSTRISCCAGCNGRRSPRAVPPARGGEPRPGRRGDRRRRRPAARARSRCRLAVTQSRGLGRLLEDHLRARPDLIAAGRRRASSRSAAARTAAASTTSRPSASRAACAASAARRCRSTS